jgi:hypothetical protein
MALPTDANIDFILCDAVRTTPEGKIDFAGYFPVLEVKVDASVPLPAGINLTFVYVIKDGEGRFRGTFHILDPLGKELHLQNIEPFDKQAGKVHLIMMQVTGIPVFQGGNFAIVLKIEGQEYRRSVRIFQ